YVLGSQSKMNEFFVLLNIQFFKFIFDKVLNRLNIMIGNLFGFFNCYSVLNSEILIKLSQFRKQGIVKILQLGKVQLYQGDKIFYLHFYSVANKCRFRKIGNKA